MELGCKPAAIMAPWLRFQGGPDGIRTPLRPSDRWIYQPQYNRTVSSLFSALVLRPIQHNVFKISFSLRRSCVYVTYVGLFWRRQAVRNGGLEVEARGGPLQTNAAKRLAAAPLPFHQHT
ncbi:hypothetical protein EJ02DRAFT_71834 [Clathrospora elynae]|uniref:Uncharacterized protein n=1 Tax=Clathrospora elynae TaxID=706981 RepID=A0A6A5SY60_9PLEO|nr:hypothetical protein EJ02DRAFT_71834 [Clathrospora elynae]